MSMKTRHRWFFRIAVLSVLLLAMLLAVSCAAAATEMTAEARSMLQMLNEFRTGGDAWYWNQNNTTKTVETGLNTLQYDLELEQVALVRAYEISQYLSHTRPDGTKWTTAYPAGNYSKAENLAAGFTTAEAAFTALMETDEPYDKQGHRRNMLRRGLTRVGFAAVEVNGYVYWVQEFASGSVKQPLNGGETVTAGWVQDGGKFYYRNADGTWATGWLEDGGKWYLLDASGAMQTGWAESGGKWYYFGTDGAMQTGWIESSGKWYYFGKDGSMQTDCWIESSGKWYYFGKDGAMQTGWVEIKEKWYFFDNNGVMQTGWFQDKSGAWFYANRNGVMQTGWQEISGSWYYFRTNGSMVTGTATINGQREVFTAGGVWLYSEIQDYDTPLGLSPLVNVLRTVWQYLQNMFSSLPF